LFHSSTAPAHPESADTNSTSPADPTTVNSIAGEESKGVDRTLAEGLARTLEIPLGLKLEKASLKWAGWESTTNFAGSDAAPDGGYEALVEKVFKDAEKHGAEVKLSTAVKNVKQSDQGVSVTTSDGAVYSARTAICTIPLAVLKELPASFFEPALPPQFQSTIKGTHVGILEKLVMQYESAWWPNAESTGSYTFLPTGPTATPNSSLEEIFAGSTLVCANFACPSLPNPSPTLLTYLSETPATLLLQHSEAQVIEAYHNFLVSRLKPTSTPSLPSAGHLTNWLTDPLSRGATTTPSIVSENGERSPMDFKELGRPVWAGKLGFAGEHTEMEHRGSVAGAVVSGQREADRVDRLLTMGKK